MTVVTANFLDTNILIYAISADPRAGKAQALLDLPFVISGQTLNEFANVSRKKLMLPWPTIAEAIDAIVALSHFIVPVDDRITLSALRLAPRYNLSFYDASMVAAALQAGCRQFHTEDMQQGLVIDSQMTVVNPFR